MADITITVTEITDGVSVESVPTSITVSDGVLVGGGPGGGAVDSVNGHTGAVVLTAANVSADASGAADAAQTAAQSYTDSHLVSEVARADAAYQPADSDLTAIAALTTTSFGRALLALADAAALRTAGGLGTAATAATTDFDAAGAAAAAQAASQPLDSDLTAIAALSTTSFGRSLLTQADAAAARATLGAGTSSLAIGVTGSTAAAGNDSRLSDARTPTAHKASHATGGTDALTASDIGAAATSHAHAAADITSGTVATARLGSGTADSTKFLRGDQTWAVPGGGSGTVTSVTAGDGTITVAGTSTDPTIAVNAIAESKVTNLVSDLAAKAPLASPTFTGTPAAPTPSGGDSTTKVATTAFVAGELTSKANLASPALTGNPTAPTQTAGNNSTRVATTAYADNAVAKQQEVLQIAVSDETTAITTGTSKVTFRMPFAMTLTGVRSSLSVASSSGLPTVDIKESGTTILSTLLSIDATEKTSVTAATAAVISDTSLADDAEITIDITTAGTGAKGLKVTLLGTRT